MKHLEIKPNLMILWETHFFKTNCLSKRCACEVELVICCHFLEIVIKHKKNKLIF